MVLETINMDFETTQFLPEEKETFLIAERRYDLLIEFLKCGMEQGEFF